ncbi:MAG: hypothetical protein FWD73_11240 [Polyangiaceae bacterium]|nr:hypothetical protein [Polyangiaceae bacterium]
MRNLNPTEAERPIVTDRAKVISVLLKAEEFMRAPNPPGITPQRVVRALDLAANHMGMKLSEYDAIVSRDPELRELERRMINNVRRHR